MALCFSQVAWFRTAEPDETTVESVVRVGGVGRWTALAASGWEAWPCSFAVARWQCVGRLLAANDVLAPRSSCVWSRRNAVAQLERSVRRVSVFWSGGVVDGMVWFRSHGQAALLLS